MLRREDLSRSNVNLGLSEIISHFEEIEDPRSPINRHHPLPSVLTISLMGVLAGSDGPTAISRWAVAKKDLLIRALDLPHGIAWRDVIRRVLSALKVDAFQSCFACWLNSLRDAAKEKAGVKAELKDHVAIDGKTMRSAIDEAGWQTHIMSGVGHQTDVCHTQKSRYLAGKWR